MGKLIFTLLVPIFVFAMDTNLIKAIKSANFEKVQSEVSTGVDINAKFEIDELDIEATPLMLASYYGNLEIVKFLIENKADVFARNSSLDSALVLAKNTKHQEVFDYLSPFFKEIKYDFFGASEEIKWANSWDEAFERAKKEKKYVIAIFMRIGCKWSKKMGESAFHDEVVINAINSSFVPILLDKEADEYPNKFYAKYTLTIFFVNEKEELKRKIYGFKDSETFLDEAKRVQDRKDRSDNKDKKREDKE